MKEALCDPASPWTVACQAPLPMEFSRQEYWNESSPGDLPNPGIKPRSPGLQADPLLSEPPGKPSLQAMKEMHYLDAISKTTNDLCSFPRQTIQYHSNPSLCPNQ